MDGESMSAVLGLHGGGDLNLLEKLSNHDPFARRRKPGCRAYFIERAINEIAHSQQAAIQHSTRRSTQAHIAPLEGLDREHGRSDQVAQFVRERAEGLIRGLAFFIGDVLTAYAPKLGDRAGDGVVEARIENAKLSYGNRRLFLDSQFGNSLAEIPVVVNNLVDSESLAQQLIAVLRRASADLRRRCSLAGLRRAGNLAKGRLI